MRALCTALLAFLWILAARASHAEIATYRLTVDNTWSEATHPGLFPPDAHFSWIGGGTHTAGVSFWEEGELATPGTKRMAEFGNTDDLVLEVEAAVVAGDADASLGWPHWFCPAGTVDDKCGTLVVEFAVDSAFPLLTLATMLGPSPDWFVGVTGLALHDGNDWVDRLVVDLRPYDAGTRDRNVLALGGPLTTPPAPIARIIAASGQIIGPDSLGSFTFERLAGPQVPALPATDRVGALTIVAALLGLGLLARRAPKRLQASGGSGQSTVSSSSSKRGCAVKFSTTPLSTQKEMHGSSH